MFWDNPNDSKDMQRFKNLIWLKMPVCNETRDEAMPVMGIVIIVCIVVTLIFALFSKAC